jgi:hypothetical protein
LQTEQGIYPGGFMPGDTRARLKPLLSLHKSCGLVEFRAPALKPLLNLHKSCGLEGNFNPKQVHKNHPFIIY